MSTVGTESSSGMMVKARRRSSDAGGRQAFQRPAGHAGDPPIRQYNGPQALVKPDGGLVPFQDRPFETAAAAVAGDPRERREKRATDSGTAMLRADEQVFEPKRAAAEKRRKSME